LEAGQPIGNRQLLNLADLASDAIDNVLPVLQNKRQELRNEIALDLPAVFVDADMIRRALTNLLENAAKYSPSKGKIEIGAHQKGDRIEVWVQDNGPGIPTTEHERIFEKFTRLQARDSARGLGMGLAYCRLILTSHGGRIWVESEPGKGARFLFTLPIAENKE
jgi:signal transduction histidine kinase